MLRVPGQSVGGWKKMPTPAVTVAVEGELKSVAMADAIYPVDGSALELLMGDPVELNSTS